MQNAIQVLEEQIIEVDGAIELHREHFIDELTVKQYSKWIRAKQDSMQRFGCDWLHNIDINKISKSQATQAYFYNWLDAVKRWNILNRRDNFYVVR
jgi:hypothetical protein